MSEARLSEEGKPLLSLQNDFRDILSCASSPAIELDDLAFSRPYDDTEYSPQLCVDNRDVLERKLLRKLDLRMSILLLMHIFNYIDRNSAAAARLRGFERDLGLEGSQFASVLSSLYVGYVLMQVPSNMFLSYIGKPSIYLPCCMAIWGTIVFCTGFANSYFGCLVTSFLLGFVEAAFFPGAFFVVTKWYRRGELSQRAAILSCGGLISNAFGSLIASGILDSMDGVLGYASWRWLFFVQGFLTVLVAIFSLFVLPDFPESNIGWLTPTELALARQRMSEDAAGTSNSNFPAGLRVSRHGNSVVAGLFLALQDWKVWWLTGTEILMTIPLSFGLYFPTLSATMGYNPTTTLLLCVPPWVAATAFSLWMCRRSDKVGERCMHVVAPLCIGIGGFVMAMLTMNTFFRYISLHLMTMSSAGVICFLAWSSSSVSDPPAKRAVALAFINAISECGSIVGSYVWPQSWGPTYNRSFAVCIATSLGCILMLFVFRWALMQLNKEIDEKEKEDDEQLNGIRRGWRYHI